MKKINILHFLIVPILTILACNGVAASFYWLDVWILIMGYGIYLTLFRTKKTNNILILVGTVIIILAWSYYPSSYFIKLSGFGLLFSAMRSLMLKKDAYGFVKDLMWVSLGFFVYVFMLPFGHSLGVAGFLIVQILCDLRTSVKKVRVVKDDFYESLKVAKSVIDLR